VAEGLILETTFLIDLEREAAAEREGPAQRFLAERAAEPVFVTFTIVGELASGHAPADRADWERFVAPFAVLQFTNEVAWEYGRLDQYLRTNGMMIGTNDLWISATALAFDRGVVTRNTREYQRVPGLTVVGYDS
jgi:tRNA(fMet)-specific endonuclease VapC